MTLPATKEDVPVPCGIPAWLAGHPRYVVEEPLGAGGMGEVFKARHRLMRRTVALKVIRAKLMDREAVVERFQREVRAAAQLSHPNIVTAFDADQAGGNHFLVMEFIEGRRLDRVVAEQGPLPVALACDFVRQAALGLQHACEHGMMHRDIKPQNLMLTAEGQIKILDFGLAGFLRESKPSSAGGASAPIPALPPAEATLAGPSSATPAERTAGDDAVTRLADEPDEEPLTGLGHVLGSPDYVAPEQIRDAHAADIRADIYSLGCTLYFLLAGRPPFAGPMAEKLRAHERKQPRPLTELRRDVPTGLVTVLDRMLAKDPARRYQTPADAARALAPFAAAPVRRRWPWIAAAAAILMLAGGLVLARTELSAVLQRIIANNGEPGQRPPGDEVRRFDAHADEEGVWGVAFAPDGDRAISCGADGYVRRWDIASGKELWSRACQSDGKCLRHVAISPDGRTILAAGYDHTVRVLDMTTGEELRRFEGHKAKVHGVSFSSDGRLALSAGGTTCPDQVPDYTVRLWEVATAREIRCFEGHTGWVRTAVFSPDDRYVLSASLDQTVRLWDARTGEEIRRFTGHEQGVLSAVFSPDGKQALSNSSDWTIRLWNVATGRELHRFTGHTDTVESVVYSADGRRALSAGKDGTVRLWDVATGNELFRAVGHAGAVHTAAFSADGQYALSGGADGTLRLWRLPE
jgi:WD40 repeat protein/tRNA A-37 threonylcarbamoyl transferase component Bud32